MFPRVSGFWLSWISEAVSLPTLCLLWLLVIHVHGDELVLPSAAFDGWKRVAPSEVGWDENSLKTALDDAGERRSSGVVFVVRGVIIAERYWDLVSERPKRDASASLRYRAGLQGRTKDGRSIEDVASVQKSVIAVLVGIAKRKGLVRLDAPVEQYLGEGWSRAARAEESQITVRHLLTMTSGLKDNLRFQAPAGKRWRYNTPAYAVLHRVLEKVAERPLNQLTQDWLLEPIGMTESSWIERRRVLDGPGANRYGFATTARDLARFGVLMLGQGDWGAKSVLGDVDYFAEMITPSQTMNPFYGYLWWLNRVDRAARTKRGNNLRVIDAAPSDLFAARGALGRMVAVVPSLNLVVVRIGDDPDVGFRREFWRHVMAAAPKSLEGAPQ